jgi:hypothetical protein
MCIHPAGKVALAASWISIAAVVDAVVGVVLQGCCAHAAVLRDGTPSDECGSTRVHLVHVPDPAGRSSSTSIQGLLW